MMQVMKPTLSTAKNLREIRRGVMCAVFGLAMLASSSLYAAPANDNLINTVAVGAAGGTFSGDNFGATFEAGETRSFGSGTFSVWWTWTPGATGSCQIDTIGSSFDTT